MAKKSGKVTKRSTSKTTKKAVKKSAAKPGSNLTSTPPSTTQRHVKPTKRQARALQKQTKPRVKLPNVWQLAKASALLLWQYKILFIGITLIYGLLNLVLVQGLANNTDVTSLKNSFNAVFNGNFGSLTSGLSVFVLLLGSAGNGSSDTAGAYQLFLGLIVSLAVIWALRQVMAGTEKLRIRDAYYLGMYPLIPLMMVLVVIVLQLIPFLIGSYLYNLVISNGIALHPIEKIIWLLIYAGLAVVSLYMLTSSLFAVYIVTLPDMTPLKALRSARGLVRYRRWIVLRKIICLPIILVVVAAIIMLPIITWLTPVSQWVFFLLTTFSLTAVHTYMYRLYRELLNE